MTAAQHNSSLQPLGVSMSLMLHVLVLGGIYLYSHWHPNIPPPPIGEIIEVTMVEAPAAPVVEELPLSPMVEEPEPVVEPLQEPEPVIEEPAPVVEEEVKIVKPETPVVEPPKVEKPKPKELEKPKTREESIRERLKQGKVIDNTQQLKEQQKRAEAERRRQEEARQRIQRRFSTAANSLQPKVNLPASSSVAGVSAGQMQRYKTYMSSCALPKVNALWQQLGPNGLDDAPTPAVLRLIVTPSGKISSFLLARRSSSPALNQCAEALGNALMREGLPPFRQVNLTTTNNAALTLDFNLEYRR